MNPRTPAVALVLWISTVTCGAEPSVADNAAALYEQASKALPRAEGRGERHVLLDVFSTPINESVETLARRAEPAMVLFDRASETTVCDWQIPASKPAAASQTVLLNGLDDFVILRARLRAARGDTAGALADCRRLALLGRRVEQVTSTTRYALGTHLYNKAILAAGILAPDVPNDQLAGFVEDLDRLPAPVRPADVVAAEKTVFALTYRRLVEDPDLRRHVEGIGGLMEDMFSVPSTPLKLDDLVADAAKREATFKEIDALFDDMAAALRLPPAQLDAQWKALAERVGNAHPLTQRARQVGVMVQHVNDGRQVMRGLLSKAVLLIVSGDAKNDAAAARLAAPYAFARRANGFELRHTPPGAKYPHVLTVGPHDLVDWDAIDKKMEKDDAFMLHEPE